jgi:hypothetical protein
MTAVPNVLRVSQNAAFTADPVRLSPFARMANEVARVTGKPATFVICCVTILVWAVTGPLFHYSDTFSLFRHLATDHQHRYYHHHVSNGFPHTKHAKP